MCPHCLNQQLETLYRYDDHDIGPFRYKCPRCGQGEHDEVVEAVREAIAQL